MEDVMQVQNESEIIDAALKKTGSTRRWLLDKLKKEYDVTLTDSMLSNRFQGRYKWKQKELKAINNILNLELKTD
jgi:uncharacterized membrane protein YcaP (DUF421 family)